jgi:hypothetical protein
MFSNFLFNFCPTGAVNSKHDNPSLPLTADEIAADCQFALKKGFECCTFTHAAEIDFPAAIIAWLNGKVPNPQWLQARPGVTSLKSILVKPWSGNPNFAD